MKIYRVVYAGEVFYAELKGDHLLRLGDVFEGIVYDGRDYLKSLVQILPPVMPSKVVCVGLNYRRHTQELKMELPKEPMLFLKPLSSVIGPDQAIVYPEQSKQVDYEAELAVVIGSVAKNVSEEDALDYVFGYTCLNDVTARDLQPKDIQWTRCKSFDTFCPIGPCIETEMDPMNVCVRSKLNGVVKQEDTTDSMIFNVKQIISYVSHVMTLLPGDVIATGTPEGVGPMQPGDVISVEVDNIGVLKNTIH